VRACMHACVCVCVCARARALWGVAEFKELIAIAIEIVLLRMFLFSTTKKGGITLWHPFIGIKVACCELACCKVLVLMCLWDKDNFRENQFYYLKQKVTVVTVGNIVVLRA